MTTLIREDDEYKAEYTEAKVFKIGKSKQSLWVPQLIKITRKIDVRNWKTNRVYPKGSIYYLSLNCAPRIPWDSTRVVFSGSGSAGYGGPPANYNVLQSGVTPNTYSGYFGQYWNGWFEHYCTVQYGASSSLDISQYSRLKLVMCGCARMCGGTRNVGSGWSNIYANTGQPGAGNEQVGLPVSMSWNWYSNTLSGVGASGVFPIKYTDFQRYAWVNSNSGMTRTGKREGGSSDSRWWTTQYYDEEDLYALGIRLK